MKTENYRSYFQIFQKYFSVSKIFEMAMFNRFIEHQNKINILDDKHHGFRMGNSTKNASISLQKGLLIFLDYYYMTLSTIPDLSKAFNWVSHDCLLKKLDKMCVQKHRYSGSNHDCQVENSVYRNM